MSRPKAAILDIDGTLIDTNDAHAHAWVDTCAEFGIQVPFAKVRPLIGMGGDKVLPELTGFAEESERGKEIKERRGAVFRERYLPSCRPFPGARELLERMTGDGLQLVVATSASKDDMGALLKAAGVADLIEAKTSSSDAEESKPEPDIVQAALDSAGCAPGEAVMLGDTPYDVEASTRAGVPCVALRCGGWWKDDDLAGAVAIYDDPAELLARYDESPLAG
ncbi:MAG TPA: HAD family hydrolase [Longimicrobium sp.]|jgi:phosphoglycolate phosphatase-like HAD superfamily hydrolase